MTKIDFTMFNYWATYSVTAATERKRKEGELDCKMKSEGNMKNVMMVECKGDNKDKLTSWIYFFDQIQMRKKN